MARPQEQGTFFGPQTYSCERRGIRERLSEEEMVKNKAEYMILHLSAGYDVCGSNFMQRVTGRRLVYQDTPFVKGEESAFLFCRNCN